MSPFIYPVNKRLDLIQFHAGPMKNMQYMLHDKQEKKIIAFDPAWSPLPYTEFATQTQSKIVEIWVTHGHFDHVNQLDELIKATDSPRVVLYKTPLYRPDYLSIRTVGDGDSLSFAETAIECIHLPGHSPDSIGFYIDGHLICGDVLFVDACGRSDLPGSNATKMKESLARIATLPSDTWIYPGHDYGPSQRATIGDQLCSNPYLIAARNQNAHMER